MLQNTNVYNYKELVERFPNNLCPKKNIYICIDEYILEQVHLKLGRWMDGCMDYFGFTSYTMKMATIHKPSMRIQHLMLKAIAWHLFFFISMQSSVSCFIKYKFKAEGSYLARSLVRFTLHGVVSFSPVHFNIWSLSISRCQRVGPSIETSALFIGLSPWSDISSL